MPFDPDDRICKPPTFTRFLPDGTVEKTFSIKGLGELVITEYLSGPFIHIIPIKGDPVSD